MAANDKRYPKPDAKWLSKSLDDCGITRAAVAEKLGIRPASIKECVDGRRMVTPAEAFELAKLFGVPQDELFRRLGYDWPAPPAEAATVPIVGKLGANGHITKVPAELQTFATAPQRDGGEQMHAVELADWNREAGFAPGTLLFFRPDTGIDYGARDRLCIVKLSPRHPMIAGVVLPAPLRHMRVALFGTRDVQESSEPISASPVLAIRAA